MGIERKRFCSNCKKYNKENCPNENIWTHSGFVCGDHEYKQSKKGEQHGAKETGSQEVLPDLRNISQAKVFEKEQLYST